MRLRRASPEIPLRGQNIVKNNIPTHLCVIYTNTDTGSNWSIDQYYRNLDNVLSGEKHTHCHCEEAVGFSNLPTKQSPEIASSLTLFAPPNDSERVLYKWSLYHERYTVHGER